MLFQFKTRSGGEATWRASQSTAVKNIARTAFFSMLALVCAGASAQAPDAERWEYSGTRGPLHWGAISGDFRECAAGHNQSPIALGSNATTRGAAPQFGVDYQSAKVTLVNNKHTILASVSDASATMTLQSRAYRLVQFHVHAPAEHTIKGKRYPLEFHFVNRDPQGRLAVLAVMVRRGKSNPAFAPYLSALPGLPGPSASQQASVPVTVDLAHMLPTDRHNSYVYNGSLTTPPCTEQVDWAVLAHPVEMSAEQIAALGAIVHGNRRPMQNGNHLAVFYER